MPEAMVVPAKTIAKLFDVTERRVQQLAKKGIITKNERGRYDLKAAVQGYIKFLRKSSLEGPEGTISLDEARRRKLSAEATLSELELEQKRETLVEAVEVEKAWFEIGQNIKGRLLAMPSHVAPLVIGETKQAVVKSIVEKEVLSTRNELSVKRATFREPAGGDKPKGVEGDGTPATVDDKRVGRPKPEVVAGS